MLLANINPEILVIGGAAIFSILVFFVIVFIVLYQRRYYSFLKEKQNLQNSFQREMLKAQLETQEHTFCQIGEEIHDNIGQLLSSTNMLLGTTERRLNDIPDTLKTAQETLSKAISELRALSKALNKEWLHQFNIVENLQTEIERINAAQAHDIRLHTTVRQLPLTREAQIMLFRIIQEAIHNSLKHANARTIQLTIDHKDFVKIIVADDGTGFQLRDSGNQGVGIINMKSRTSLLGGTITWKSGKGGGTEVEILLPFKI